MPIGIYPRTKEHCQKISIARKKEWANGERTMRMSFKGFHHSNKSRIKISNTLKKSPNKSKYIFKKGLTPWNKGLKGFMGGSKHWHWKGGISRTVLYRRFYKNRSSIRRRDKINGILNLQNIQQVYEDNIKRYGTLICYLCLQPIPFGQDCLEHKIPLSRGGTNTRENLDVAHRTCNNKKWTKTEEEYRKELLIEY